MHRAKMQTPSNNFSPRLSSSDIAKLRAALPRMPEKQKRKTAELLKQYQTEMTKEKGRNSFLDFIKHVYPG